ncbi:hypothetical protein Sjap_002212 [Stephania japonica]|uniref:Uncharacterized protein n=1 Tax=Stephania japonica TaxID=461633 RepID=A0AAP0PSG2_9MAGN
MSNQNTQQALALPEKEVIHRTFQDGYLVTTSLQSLAPPSASPSFFVKVTTSGMAAPIV